MEEPWTILKVLRWTADYFGRKGLEQPRADAEVLLAHVLEMPRLQLYLQHDRPLSPSELASYREAVKRRAAREPAQYITGIQEFWSLELKVSPSVLIPRPETELLVERALELAPPAPSLILDLGAGSGALAVALAHERPQWSIVAADRSPEALKVARDNAIRHQVASRIFFLAGDLLAPFSSWKPAFDMIVTNPPYIPDEDFGGLPPEVAAFEPREALAGGGRRGLEAIRRILSQAPSFLKPRAPLLMEVGMGQSDILQKELEGDPRWKGPRFYKDYSGIWRVLYLCKTEE